MPLASGQTLSHYEILGPLGAGGMGEVWRARDTRLDREVAIKVLPEHLAVDQDRLQRFEREARTLASLTHPNVAGIHGVDQVGDTCFLALELVPGEDLADRLSRGALPLEGALDVCRQIAEGLEAAHESGVVHRDLKPANVRITPEGVVKLIDFGLAKPLPSVVGTEGTTATAPDSFLMTEEGVVLGTPTYMSPEQARGRPVDRRTDIWAFGCVLYECLVGERAFSAETAADLLSAILTQEPLWERIPEQTPARVRELIRRCLRKDVRLRLRDIGEARIVLAEVAADPQDLGSAVTAPLGTEGSGPPPGVSRSPPRAVLSRVLGLLVALVAGGALGRWSQASEGRPEIAASSSVAFTVDMEGAGIQFGPVALSPDSRQLAFLARDERGDEHIWVRPLDTPEARQLPHTAGADHPFWSPDSTELGFFAGDRLFRVSLDGSAPRAVANFVRPRGGSWNAEGTIVVGSDDGPIYRVRAGGGGSPEAITVLEAPAESTHAWPVFLPDGRRFVFMTDSNTNEGHRIRLASIDGGPSAILRTHVRSNAIVDPRGALLFVEGSRLMAQPFDFELERVAGDLVPVAEGLWSGEDSHGYPFSLSANGGLAYQRGAGGTEIVRVDLTDKATTVIATGDDYHEPALSPDGRYVAYHGGNLGGGERLIWVEDVARGTRTLISDRGKLADSPTWSPDGSLLYFDMQINAEDWQSYRRLADGGRPAEKLPMPPGCYDMWTLDVSRDGRWLLMSAVGDEVEWGLYMLPLEVLGDVVWTDAMPADRIAAVTGAWRRWPADDRIEYGRLSPDGRWIAYRSDSSGREEIYVASVEKGPAAGRLQLSVEGAHECVWAPDGSRLYYRARNDVLMEVELGFEGDAMEAGTPRELFHLAVPPAGINRNALDIAADGGSLIVTQVMEEGFSEIHVRLGWHW